jgi:hypothetical protein
MTQFNQLPQRFALLDFERARIVIINNLPHLFQNSKLAPDPCTWCTVRRWDTDIISFLPGSMTGGIDRSSEEQEVID